MKRVSLCLVILALVAGACSSAKQIRETVPTAAASKIPITPTESLTPGVRPWVTPTATSTVSLESVVVNADALQWFQKMGVNLAGAEFGRIPGKINTDYIYPSCSDMKVWISKGITLFRYPVRIERLADKTGLTSDFLYIERLLECASGSGAKIILDAHNYGRIFDKDSERIIEESELSGFWALVSERLAYHPGLAGYGLMNEPHDMGGVWPSLAQSAVNAIRNWDTKTPILVSGDCWGSADSWKDCNGELYDSVRDEYSLLIFEAHQYFDPPDYTGFYDCGTAQECNAAPESGVKLLQPFLDWCDTHQSNCFIGEMGVPIKDLSWQPLFREVLTLLNEKEVGSTVWAAGPWWGDYPLSLEKKEAIWIIDELIR